MGKPIAREFGQELGILKYFPYEADACLVPQSMGVDDGNGNLVVVAGTPFPSNDANCKGYLLHTVDVTRGDAPGTKVYQGSIDNAKLAKNKVTVSADAKAATPRVTFFD